MELRRKVGQLLIAGLEGDELTPLERAWWGTVQPGGVILFRRNIETAEQTHRLLRGVNLLSARTPFRCVDLEGGLVDRLRDLTAPMPAAAEVFATSKTALFRKHGRLIGQEARMLGFNTVLAPVLDLALAPSQPVLRTRAASPDPTEVVRYASAFLGGLHGESVLGCGKHFPGLGGGTLDSHESTPVIDRTWSEMWSEDLAPYRALRKQLPIVMISHATYPAVTKDFVPASISKYWITEILRQKLRYNGLVLSDDMEMGGILSHSSIEDAAIAAVAAGSHLLEVCKDPALLLRAYEALLREAEHSAPFRSIVEAAERKLTTTKRKLLGEPMPKAPTSLQVKKMRSAILSFKDQISSAVPRVSA